MSRELMLLAQSWRTAGCLALRCGTQRGNCDRAHGPRVSSPHDKSVRPECPFQTDASVGGLRKVCFDPKQSCPCAVGNQLWPIQSSACMYVTLTLSACFQVQAQFVLQRSCPCRTRIGCRVETRGGKHVGFPGRTHREYVTAHIDIVYRYTLTLQKTFLLSPTMES